MAIMARMTRLDHIPDLGTIPETGIWTHQGTHKPNIPQFGVYRGPREPDPKDLVPLIPSRARVVGVSLGIYP